jgi:very-short-patch-repair endonuclease
MVLDVASVVGPDGWTTWRALTARVDRKTVVRWTAAGTLVRLQPGIYATPEAAAQWRVRVEAAVLSRGGVASHRTALALWGLVQPGGPVHLTVESGRSNRSSPGVVLHRAHGLQDAVRSVDGVPVTCVERALVDTWGHPGSLATSTVRAAAITAVRRRMCRPRDLALELDRRPQLRARASLAELVRLLAAGCQSELKIWGCLIVPQAPGMPRFSLQHRVVVGGQTFFLDAACEEVQLAVEMDGAAWHGSRDQRERDIRRDALLATVGWQTLRFSFPRLTGSPDGCRHEIRAVHAARLTLIQTEWSAVTPRSGAPNGASVRLTPPSRAPRWAAPASRSRPASATRP